MMDFEKTAARNYPDAKSLPFAEHAMHEHSSSNVGIASTSCAFCCQGSSAQGNPLQHASLRTLLLSHLQPQDQSPAPNILRRMLDSAIVCAALYDRPDRQPFPVFRHGCYGHQSGESQLQEIYQALLGYEGLSRRSRDTSMSCTASVAQSPRVRQL